MKWTTEETNFLLENILLSPREVHLSFIQEFGNVRSLEGVRKKMKDLRREIVDTEDEEQVLLESLSPLELLSLDPIVAKQNALLWLDTISKLYKKHSPIAKPGIVSKNSSLVVMLSDVHFGKLTESGFTTSVATSRLQSIPQKILENLGAEPRDIGVDEIVLLLLGDEVEGEDIFERQNASIEVPVILQSKFAIMGFWNLIHSLHNMFGLPVRVETVPGNHGRMSKTSDAMSNWDNSVYQTLGILDSMENNKDITMNINMKNFNIVNIKGHKIYMNHEGTKHLGTPAMKMKFAGWIITKGIDLLNHGHWHSVQIGSFVGRKTIGNGCLCGPDDLSERMASEEPPAQVFYILKPGQKLDSIHILNW